MTKKYTKIQEELPDEQIDSKEPFVLHAEDSESSLVSFSGKPKMSGCRIRSQRQLPSPESKAEETASQHWDGTVSVKLFGGNDTYVRHGEKATSSVVQPDGGGGEVEEICADVARMRLNVTRRKSTAMGRFRVLRV